MVWYKLIQIDSLFNLMFLLLISTEFAFRDQNVPRFIQRWHIWHSSITPYQPAISSQEQQISSSPLFSSYNNFRVDHQWPQRKISWALYIHTLPQYDLKLNNLFSGFGKGICIFSPFFMPFTGNTMGTSYVINTTKTNPSVVMAPIKHHCEIAIRLENRLQIPAMLRLAMKRDRKEVG